MRITKTIRFILCPPGVELPLTVKSDDNGVQLIRAQALMPDTDIKGTWQLIVRQTRPGFGLMWGATLKLD